MASAVNGTGTESWRPDLADLDRRPPRELVALFVDGEITALHALRARLEPLARAVDEVADRFAAGGRLVYAGAGTAGRLGLLDAVECGPTFGLGPDQVTAVLAGGTDVLEDAREDAEDDEDAGRAAVRALGLRPQDSIVAVSASGRTPYTIGAAREAGSAGALRIGVICNEATPLAAEVDVAVEVPVGPELLAGSTRLKSGTVQKVALNALSTLVMVRAGRTYGNLMVDLRATNAKLRSRARTIVALAAGVDESVAGELLTAADGEVKTAVVAAMTGRTTDEARTLLADAGGHVRAAVGTRDPGGRTPPGTPDPRSADR